MTEYIVIGLVIIAAVLCIRFRKFGLLTCLAGASGWVYCFGMQAVYELKRIARPDFPPYDSTPDSVYLANIEALEPWVIGFGVLFWIGVVWCVVNLILRRRRKAQSV